MLAAVWSSLRAGPSTISTETLHDESDDWELEWDAAGPSSVTIPWSVGWSAAVDVYQRTMDASRAVIRAVDGDVENIAKLFADMDTNEERADDAVVESPPSPSTPTATGPKLPTIVVTLCADTPREVSSWIPYQDASFGARLVVPNHAAVNTSHPPLALPSRTIDWMRAWPDRRWTWHAGHWRLVLPPPEEQAKRGMFSRAHGRKTRRTRKLR